VDLTEFFKSEFAEHQDTARRTEAALCDAFAGLVRACAKSVREGGKLLFFGNGGSAADAQHLAAEYVVRFKAARRGWPAMALTTDSSVLTAAANDLGFEQVFARQVEALCRPGDLLVLHSTSGASANLLRAAQTARAIGVSVVAFLGRDGGPLAREADLVFVVRSDDTARIQEMHLAVQHIIAGLLDREDLA
jgi:D-sedoheptulose 7-phosphate isomerase